MKKKQQSKREDKWQAKSDPNKEDRENRLYILDKPLDTSEKIVIDIKEIKDFCLCPMYHNIKYSNDNEINIKDLYEFELKKVFYNYLKALQEGTLKNTIQMLKYQWGKSWIKNKTATELIVTATDSKVDSWNTRRKNGIECILNFDEAMSLDEQYPIVINHKYEIEIIPGVILTGTFEYIREITDKDGNDIIQLINFDIEPSNKTNNHAMLNNIISIASAYAFNELFEPTYFQNVVLNVSKNKFYINKYSEKHFKLLKNTIKSVIISLQNDINCISFDERCYRCSYKKTCKAILGV